ncbi:MAG: pyridoxamine 5'-phosphate oxidase [Myxococcota bacterium]|nr:pyridoxamine 5'-phosphate oxidase [Myxococcota bacterium]
MSIEDLRLEYARGTLDENDVDLDPFAQFNKWLDEAIKAQLREPTAMTLATVDADGSPSARIALLKGVDRDGFVFFTNYDSRKGRAIAVNPRVAMCFWWNELERQVRIEGLATKVSDEESARYFATRPRASQLGAWASPQSSPVRDRAELEKRLEDVKARYGDGPIERPPHWGGYRVAPTRFEFWHGRPSRLHDRIAYVPHGPVWRTERLGP